MRSCRVHITGASGAGVTTLGRALASRLSIPHQDTDDYYWSPTNPPFRDKRAIPNRLQLMEAIFLARPAWVLSGSLDGWGNPLIPVFDSVVFVRAPTEIRLKRLRDREALRYGFEAITPGDERHQAIEAFLDWASHYDDGSFSGRSLIRHETWLQTLSCPVLRVDGTRATVDLVQEVLDAVGVVRPSPP